MAYILYKKPKDIPIVLVNEGLTEIPRIGALQYTTNIPRGFGHDLDKVTYVLGTEPSQNPTSAPDKNGYVWTLPNGQAFPPTRIILFSQNRRTYYYEDKDLTTKFQVIGKTIEQCSRVSNEAVGEFTGNRNFNTVDPFGKGYTLRSLQVKTKFPFDRMGNPVETEYTLWVDTLVKYFEDNVQSITTNEDGTLTYHYLDGNTLLFTQDGKPLGKPGTTGSSGGYSTGNGSSGEKPAAKNTNALLIGGGLLLLALTGKRKRK